MEWVQTTGDSVEAAKDRALDELGVDEQDAEFEVLDEPKSGLFGRTRGEARVKARVRPTQPRAKGEGRDRGRGGKGGGRGGRSRGKGGGGRQEKGQNGGGKAQDRGRDKPSGGRDNGGSSSGEQDRSSNRAEQRGGEQRKSNSGSNRSGQARNKGSQNADGNRRNDGGRQDKKDTTRKESTMTEDVAIDEQGDIVAGFLEGLLDAFGADGEVVQEQVDDSTVELRVEGDDLGRLVGPRGATLAAVHEMCRTVLQREVAGGARARIRVDIGGYRERRRAALADFARTQADGVLEDQAERALEPMGAADRKVIHDTVTDIDGVRTISEGEDPKRRVVIIPDND